jgi:hypothetical protein
MTSTAPGELPRKRYGITAGTRARNESSHCTSARAAGAAFCVCKVSVTPSRRMTRAGFPGALGLKHR